MSCKYSHFLATLNAVRERFLLYIDKGVDSRKIFLNSFYFECINIRPTRGYGVINKKSKGQLFGQ